LKKARELLVTKVKGRNPGVKSEVGGRVHDRSVILILDVK